MSTAALAAAANSADSATASEHQYSLGQASTASDAPHTLPASPAAAFPTRVASARTPARDSGRAATRATRPPTAVATARRAARCGATRSGAEPPDLITAWLEYKLCTTLFVATILSLRGCEHSVWEPCVIVVEW